MSWRARAASPFRCEKQPATSSRGMVVTNHPLASAAGAEMLAAGGNAVDAAIAALFTLTVVEPMMVGIFGGGMAHIRLPDGTHTVIDGLSTAPAATGPDTYRPVSDMPGPDYLETEGRENAVGPRAVAAPGNLKAWCETLARFGRLPLGDVIDPAIRHASRGFAVTPYLSSCIEECAADLARDAEIARLYLPGGKPAPAGHRLVQSDYAGTLRGIAREGADILYGGTLGRSVTAAIAQAGGFLTLDDLTAYRTVERAPVRGPYRGFEIVGPPPPSSGGVHVLQMLNILEGYDIAAMGFGSADHLHLVAEVLKIAFADRAAATADPAFVQVPVERLISKDYAAERRASIDLGRAQSWSAGVAAGESANTTHVTVADRDGHVISTTQTINSLFGARFILPGTGIIPNNYMYLFDPHPGKALSVQPGKRITTSQAPLIALKDGKPAFALGLPGGLRIFGSAMQAVINLIDHGMSLQEAVEAPRLWTQGQTVEVEEGFAPAVREALRERGHDVVTVPHVGGGMNAIAFHDDGTMTGAACWRADGTPVGLSGGLARADARFWPDLRR
ncbi:MAG TPA: gamma-glutamyltransferase [Ferrovibrio sp.]|uniref:gamma-glutamyltransferase n=1 Tax=Ferrovibrio sp. TaxID=1917215 RepID=UPI002B4B3058|nr:gamma-glutamyltransferase [Ferrovibrio sp.]HLT76263.1 gamma-glutamyltransferase [Ferrovibrio sp.]